MQPHHLMALLSVYCAVYYLIDMVKALPNEWPNRLRVLKASALHESDASPLQRLICFVLSAFWFVNDVAVLMPSKVLLLHLSSPATK